MKLKLLIFNIIFCSFFNQLGYAQTLDTIKGRIVSSISLKKPIGEIYVMEKWTSNGTIADSLGQFRLVPLKEKSKYILQISAGFHKMQEYEFKSEWLKRKNSKTIVVNGNCQINKQKAKDDLKIGQLELYIFGGIAPVANSKRDSRFEKKFKIKYLDLGCGAKIMECILEYNNYVFSVLNIRYGNKWRKNIRSDVEGLNEN